MDMRDQPFDFVKAWHTIWHDYPRPATWVVFKRGTSVILPPTTKEDAQRTATETLQKTRPQPGCYLGDTTTSRLKKGGGWAVVNPNTPCIFNLVPDGAVKDLGPHDIGVAIYGRTQRQLDTDDPVVIAVDHVVNCVPSGTQKE